MKTRIDLYRDEFKPQFIWVSAVNTIFLTIFSLILMGAVYFGIWQDQQTQTHELAQVKSSIDAKQKKLNDLSKKLTSRSLDPALLAKLELSKMELSTAQRLADKLESLGKLQEKPFSSVLNSLAEINNKDIWLTSFKINEKDILINGKISKPGALPVWLKSIGKTDFFKDRDFRAATVSRTAEQLSFTIQSKDAQSAANQGGKQ